MGSSSTSTGHQPPKNRATSSQNGSSPSDAEPRERQQDQQQRNVKPSIDLADVWDARGVPSSRSNWSRTRGCPRSRRAGRRRPGISRPFGIEGRARAPGWPRRRAGSRRVLPAQTPRHSRRNALPEEAGRSATGRSRGRPRRRARSPESTASAEPTEFRRFGEEPETQLPPLARRRECWDSRPIVAGRRPGRGLRWSKSLYFRVLR